MDAQPPMDMGTPPAPDMNGTDMPQDMGGQPPMDDGSMGDPSMGSEFDTNFDAGVDADEESDPKKYIQQLTGKLSQTLRSYNENLPQPDADLNKFVAGMINKQAIDGLNQNDIDDILKKIKNDEPIDNSEQGGDQEDNAVPPATDENMPMESVNRRKQIDEIFNDVITLDDEQRSVSDKTIKQPNSFRRKPFTSPTFN